MEHMGIEIHVFFPLGSGELSIFTKWAPGRHLDFGCQRCGMLGAGMAGKPRLCRKSAYENRVSMEYLTDGAYNCWFVVYKKWKKKELKNGK